MKYPQIPFKVIGHKNTVADYPANDDTLPAKVEHIIDAGYRFEAVYLHGTGNAFLAVTKGEGDIAGAIISVKDVTKVAYNAALKKLINDAYTILANDHELTPFVPFDIEAAGNNEWDEWATEELPTEGIKP